MMQKPNIKLYSVVIDCPDPQALAQFYGKLIGWNIVFTNEEYIVLGAPHTAQGAYPCITFQLNPDYIPPVWPEQRDAQQQMEHLDFAVDDPDAAVAYALQLGASRSPVQFSDDWIVMFDPVGHPFCLCKMKSMMNRPDFSLK